MLSQTVAETIGSNHEEHPVPTVYPVVLILFEPVLFEFCESEFDIIDLEETSLLSRIPTVFRQPNLHVISGKYC